MFSEAGYSGYYDARAELDSGRQGNIGAVFADDMGSLFDGPVAYSPNVGPVGSAAKGNYYPGDVTGDASALNYLGFLSDGDYNLDALTTRGSMSADRSAGTGAWFPAFQRAVRAFEAASGLPVDAGWIGPNTRRSLQNAVQAKNASLPASPPYAPPGADPPLPSQPSGAQPSAPHAKPNYLLYGGIAAGAVALLAGAYFLID